MIKDIYVPLETEKNLTNHLKKLFSPLILVRKIMTLIQGFGIDWKIKFGIGQLQRKVCMLLQEVF